MNNNLTMEDLYKKLDSLGYSKEFIRSIGLPSWWADELDKSLSNSVALEAAGHISQRLTLDLKSLIGYSRLINLKTYDETIETLKERKRLLLELKRLDTDILANDVNDYFEQLLLLNI